MKAYANIPEYYLATAMQVVKSASVDTLAREAARAIAAHSPIRNDVAGSWPGDIADATRDAVEYTLAQEWSDADASLWRSSDFGDIAYDVSADKEPISTHELVAVWAAAAPLDAGVDMYDSESDSTEDRMRDDLGVVSRAAVRAVIDMLEAMVTAVIDADTDAADAADADFDVLPGLAGWILWDGLRDGQAELYRELPALLSRLARIRDYVPSDHGRREAYETVELALSVESAKWVDADSVRRAVDLLSVHITVC